MGPVFFSNQKSDFWPMITGSGRQRMKQKEIQNQNHVSPGNWTKNQNKVNKMKPNCGASLIQWSEKNISKNYHFKIQKRKTRHKKSMVNFIDSMGIHSMVNVKISSKNHFKCSTQQKHSMDIDHAAVVLSYYFQLYEPPTADWWKCVKLTVSMSTTNTNHPSKMVIGM